MDILKMALSDSKCILSVIGEHAGEDIHSIFKRKMDDINRIGFTFWLMRSPKAHPQNVQEVCKESPAYVFFIEPASPGGSRPTKMTDMAKEYSPDGKSWYPLPRGLSPVTGKLNRQTAALIFDFLTTNVIGTIDLWEYADFFEDRKPIKFILGSSTVCAIKKDTSSSPYKMKSRYRLIVAMARLKRPYCVWIR